MSEENKIEKPKVIKKPKVDVKETSSEVKDIADTKPDIIEAVANVVELEEVNKVDEIKEPKPKTPTIIDADIQSQTFDEIKKEAIASEAVVKTKQSKAEPKIVNISSVDVKLCPHCNNEVIKELVYIYGDIMGGDDKRLCNHCREPLSAEFYYNL